MTDFETEMKDFAIEKLDDLEGLNVYACDLTSELTRDDNATGAYIIGYSEALDYIGERISAAADAWNYYNDELNTPVNPFEYPELFTFCMLDYGVREVMGRVKYLNDHWDERITLDAATIGIITAQLNDDKDDEAAWYLAKHTHIEKRDAEWLIEWIADNPTQWAEAYAPYIGYLPTDETVNEYEADNPYDNVYDDAQLMRPIIIHESPVNYYI